MSHVSLGLDPALRDYLQRVSLRETDVMRRLRAETAKMEWAMMQISPEQGQLMALLAELLGVRKALEIGTFTGYSALAVARALPADGRLVACDMSKEWTDVARRYWQEAGVEGRIELRLGAALETLDGLIAEGQAGTFDMAFIDADKSNYDAYYERALALLRTGGLVLIDNVLWDGNVIDPDKNDADTQAIRALNDKIHADRRVTATMVPIGDGLTLARKR